MSMGEATLWSIPAMQTGEDDITTVIGNLTAYLENIDTAIAPMRAMWSGTGSESYDAVQKRWNDAMNAMIESLTRIKVALAEAISIHSQTEGSVTSAWG
jgi:early secretory antigenic target protein ESAT-6